MSKTLHRAVSTYLDAFRELQASNRPGFGDFSPLIDALHRASADLYPLLEEIAPTDLIEQMRRVDEGFSASTMGTISFTELEMCGPRIVRELERVKRDCEPFAVTPDPAATSSPSLRLLLAECPPQPPEPPPNRIRAAALFVADVMSASRLTADGVRELRLSALAGFSRREGAVPGVDSNGYRWAVRRLTEAGLVTVEMANVPPAVRLGAMQRRKLAGLPVKDAAGEWLPDVGIPRPPVPHIRSTPELWERWRAGRMFEPNVAIPVDTKSVTVGNITLAQAGIEILRSLTRRLEQFPRAGSKVRFAFSPVSSHLPYAGPTFRPEHIQQQDWHFQAFPTLRGGKAPRHEQVCGLTICVRSLVEFYSLPFTWDASGSEVATADARWKKRVSSSEFHQLAAEGGCALPDDDWHPVPRFLWAVVRHFAGNENFVRSDPANESIILHNPGLAPLLFCRAECSSEQITMPRSGLTESSCDIVDSPPAVSTLPVWNAETRTLTFGGCTHTYRKRAASQERILAMFQEAGWPNRVTAGLPDHLAGIVRNMSRTLGSNCPLAFEMDGTSQGVRWRHRASSTEVT